MLGTNEQTRVSQRVDGSQQAGRSQQVDGSRRDRATHRTPHSRLRRPAGILAATLLSLFATTTLSRAEGVQQIGLNQPLQEFGGTGTAQNRATAITVDILEAGEVINLSACGENDTQQISFEIIAPDGTQVLAPTPRARTVDCDDDMTGDLNPDRTPVKYVTQARGQYEVRLRNLDGFYLNRYDVTVTGSVNEPVFATAANRIVGRVASKRWRHNAGNYSPADATDADYYILTPSGVVDASGNDDSNYVWKLDLNNFAGFVYELIANGIGVDNAPSFSVPKAGNSVSPRYDIYINYPVVAKGPPSAPPSVSSLRFEDDGPNPDASFSPGANNTPGVQDSGRFIFDTDVQGATFTVAIDTGGPNGTGPDGVYGGEGDVFLSGYTVAGTNSIDWDGRDVVGNFVGAGNYTAELSVRMGEFHFVADDVETSGGTEGATQVNGLTVWEARNGSQVPTLVYYDDKTILIDQENRNGGRSVPPVTLPQGALSGTQGGYHTWGNYSAGAFGNEAFIDTFVYGRTTSAITTSTVTVGDDPATGNFNGFVDIDAMGVGDDVALLLADEDLDGQPTASGVVTNLRTGDQVSVTLSADPNQPGTFLFDMPTTTGATTATTLSVAPGDQLAFSYDDAANRDGVPETFTANDTVGGTDGTTSVTADIAGRPARLSVDDADLAGTGTLDVQVRNTRTGETEVVTLVENGNTGTFLAQLPTDAAAGAGANDSGRLNVQTNDLIEISYTDALRANGLTNQPILDDDPVRSGTPASVTIGALRVSEPVSLAVLDGDRAGFGSIVVSVTNIDTGETEQVTLLEVPGRPGEFEGTVDTVFGAAASPNQTDGSFNAEAGDTFRIDYADDARPAGSPAVVSATGPIAGGTDATASITGAPVGQPVTLEVRDADLAGAGDLDVTVRNVRTNGTEIVQLVETGPGTGIFQATLPTRFGALADPSSTDGSLNAAAGDTVRIEYDEAIGATGAPALVTDDSTMTGGADGTVSITGGRVGLDTLALSLDDADLSGPSADVLVTNLDTGETETVTLTRSGMSYTGSVSTVFGTDASTNTTDGVFNAEAGDRFEIRYSDAFASTGATNIEADAEAPVTGGTTGVAEVDATVVGASVLVRLTDPDLAGDGTVVVSLDNGARGSETVALSEVSPGVFEATVDTAYGTGPDASDTDGSINAVAGDTLTVSLTDTFRTDGSSGPVTANDIIGGGVDGTTAIVATTVGADVTLRVQDDDLSGAADVIVTLLNTVTGEAESVTLQPDPSVSGGFLGTFPTQFGTQGGTMAGGAGDGVLNVEANELLRVTYVDALAADGSTANRTADDTIDGGTTATVAIDATTIGTDATLSVSDLDRDGATSIDVSVTNGRTGEVETVTLLPGANAGEFTGTLPTAFDDGSSASNDGTMGARDDDPLTIAYVDPLAADGGSPTIEATDPIDGGATGTTEIVADAPGQPLQVSVSDADLAGGADFSVVVTNTQTGETETVLVSEGATPGLFTGTLPTRFGTNGGTNAGPNDDGTLDVEAAETLLVTYSDALRQNGSAGDAIDTDDVRGGADGTPLISDAVVGDPVTVSVTDADLSSPSITVTVSNPAIAGETETLTLARTGPGTYSATLDTAFGTAAGTLDDGTINGQSGDNLVVTYRDVLAANGAADTDRTATGALSGGDTGLVSIAIDAVGDDVELTVTDRDLDNAGTLDVIVANDTTGETRTVTLSEGPLGTFTGTAATVFGTAANNATLAFEAQTGDTFSITYADTLRNDGSAGSAGATDTVGGGSDAVAGIVAGAVGEALQLSVSDPDRTGDTAITVEVRNTVTGETETVSLSGTGGNFTGTLPTTFGAGDGSGTNGSIDASAGDPITISYLDPFAASGGPQTVTASDAPTGGNDGTVLVQLTRVGEPVTVTVTDPDLTVASGAAAPEIVLVNATTGETETLQTVRVGNTNAFTATVSTNFGTAEDPAAGAFNAVAGDVFTATYADAFGKTGGPATPVPSDDDTIGGGTTGTPIIVLGAVGTDASISVEDADLAGGPDFAVTITNTNTGETETVTLTESATPGLFTATLPTAFATAPDGTPGTLGVQADDRVTVDYADAIRDNGSAGTETAEDTVPRSETGTVNIAVGRVGEPVGITVTDADLAGTTSITVELENTDTGEIRSVTLLQSAPGTFTGDAPTTFGATANNATPAFEADSGDTFLVTYNDARDATGAPASPTDSAPITGGDTATVSVSAGLVGEPVSLSFVDGDLASTNGTPATVDVTLLNNATGETETVALTETSAGSGSFAGQVATVYGTAPNPAAGTFAASANDVFTVTGQDALTNTGGTATPSDTDTIGGGTTGTPSIAVGAANGTANLSVNDADLAGAGSITVEVTNTDPARGETETVTLNETGPNSGLFTGTVATVFGNAANPAPGTFAAQNGDLFEIRYADAFDTDGTTQVVADTDTVGGTVSGTPAIAPGRVGEPVALSVSDGDLAGTPSIIVTVLNERTGETETVQLDATAPGSATFQGSLPTTFGANAGTDGDGTMAASANDDLTLRYDDAEANSGGAETFTDTAPITGGADGTITLTAGLPSDGITVTLSDSDLPAGQPVDVVVTNPSTGETETLTLNETAPGSGTFTAVLPTTFSETAIPAAGQMGVQAGDRPTVSYNDALRADGSSATISDDDAVRGGTDGQITVSVGRIGEPITVTLSDADLSGNGTVDVRLANLDTPDNETLTLTEVAPGVFEATVATAYGTTPDAAPGIFTAEVGDEFRATVTDQLDASGGSMPLANSGFIQGGVTGVVTLTAGTVGEPLEIVVEDDDLRGGAPFTVSVFNATTGETETVSVAETSPGRFVGTLPTTFGTADDGANGSLPVAAGDPLTATYADALRTDGTAGNETGTGSPTGGDTAELELIAGLPGEPITVRLTDADLASAPQLTITNPTTGETETVSTTEGPVGVFTAQLPTTFGTADDGANGSLVVAAGDVPTVTFADALRDDGSAGTVSASDPVKGGTTADPAIVASAVGEPLALTVRDADSAGDGTLVATVTNPVSGDTETVTLVETTPGSGTFTADLPTAFGATGTADGTLQVAAGDVVTLSYDDPADATGGPQTVTASDAPTGGENGTVEIAVGTPGTDALVTVSDADLAGTAPFNVSVTNLATGEVETVLVSEGTTPGTFTGTLSTAFGTAGDGDNGTLQVAADDVIQVAYSDLFTDTGSSAVRVDDDAVPQGSTGVVAITATVPGEPADIALIDADLAGQDTALVTVVNTTTGETETVTLLETATPGTFEAQLPTRFGTSDGDDTGAIEGVNDDVLRVSYTDALNANGGTGSDTDDATLNGGNTAVPQLTAGAVGDPLTLTITDPDLAGEPEITVTLRNPRTGETETVTLLASPLGSDTFTATLDTVFGDEDPAPGSIGVQAGDPLTLLYTDPLSANGGPVDVAATAQPTGGVTATLDAPNVAVGEPLVITLVDPDRAGGGPVSVDVTNPDTGETETVTLIEDPATPGTFTASLPTVFGTADDATPDQIAVAAGVVLDITHTDPLTENGSAQPVATTSTPTGGNTGDPSVAAVTVGDPITLSLSDPDIAGAGTLSVLVLNEITGETETVTLTEDPNAPGTFGADLPSTFGDTPGTNDDGTLAVAAGDTVTIAYDDGFRDDGSAGIETASTVVGGGTTGTVAATPAPVGQPIPITVSDPDLAGATTIMVSVLNPDTGGTQMVALTVDPTDPTVFTGELPTVYGTVDDGDPMDGALPVTATSVLEVTYEDTLSDAGGVETVVTTVTPTGGTDATVSIADVVTGSDAPITLIDPDLAGTPSVTVTVTNATTGETETVTLLADPNDPTLFTGGVGTTFGTDPGAPGDGTLNVASGDVLEVAYTDPFGADGGETPVADTATVGAGTTATVSIETDTVGEPFTVTVVDPDRTGTGPLTATVTTPSGDAETVELIEDPANPGTFVATLPTGIVPPSGTTPGDGTLSVTPGTEVSVSFDDPLSDTGAPIEVSTTEPVGNGAPVGTPDTAATAPGVEVVMAVLVNDSDPEGSPLVIASVTQPPNGTVVIRPDGTLGVTPDTGFTGTLDFSYTIRDPEGLETVVLASVTVDADAPTATADTYSVPEDAPAVLDVLVNDSDPSGGDLVITQVTVLTGGGTATVLSDGTIEYVPAPGYTGPVTLEYEITNDSGLTDTASVDITVEADPVLVANDEASTPAGEAVVIDVTANDPSWDPATGTVRLVSTPVNGTANVLADGTISYIPNDPDYSGTETFTYELCIAGRCAPATVSVTVEPPTANIAGVVFRDLDHDGTRDAASEPGLPGWTVELRDANGVLIATTVSAGGTDQPGSYTLGPVPTGEDYTLTFLHPTTGEVFDTVDVALQPGGGTANLPLPIDPSGVVYDVLTREPVQGAIVTIRSASGDGTPGAPLPGACVLGRDSAEFTTADDGYYEFFLVPGAAPECPAGEANYALTVQGPNSEPLASSTPPVQQNGRDAILDPTGLGRTRADGVDIYTVSPFSEVPGPATDAPRYFLAFTLGTGDPQVVNNHLPLAITPAGDLLVTKTALTRTVAAGQMVPYRITVRNASNAARAGITVVDDLPPGFRYKDGSSSIDGVRTDARVRGRNVQYRGLDLPANGEITISLVAVAGSTIAEGTHTNRAFVRGAGGTVISNVAEADVEFAPDPDFDCSTVIGRVFVDTNENGRMDRGEEGLPGIRIASVDGLLVTTGAHGRYHVPCAAVPNAAIGSTHVMKVDTRTLPFGFVMDSANPQVTRLTRGKATKVNFAVHRLAEIRLDFSAHAFRLGSTGLLPAHAEALAGLIENLARRPASLKLVYHAEPGEIGGRERMRAVASRVEQLWKRRGAPYDLGIERTVERALALRNSTLVTKG